MYGQKQPAHGPRHIVIPSVTEDNNGVESVNNYIGKLEGYICLISNM